MDGSNQYSVNNPESPNYFPPACRASASATVPPSSDPYVGWKTPQINTCVSAMKNLIDWRFNKYEDALQATNSQMSMGVDSTVITLGAIGAASAGPTAQILSAASAVLTGVKGKYDSDILYSHSINLILQQMKSGRAAQAIVINAKLTAPGSKGYQNMYDAANDLLAYARAGSWTEALISLEASAGSQAQACSTQEMAAKINAAGGVAAPAANIAGGKIVAAANQATNGQCNGIISKP
jgi:hypothetical protein